MPVALLFTHAYFSGKKRTKLHLVTGMTGIVIDLSFSIFYMLYRTAGGATEGGILSVAPGMMVYFAVHGVIAAVVIALELAMLGTGFLQWRRKKPNSGHRRLALPLYALWFIAFLSGEVVYGIYYLL
jgi:uncharacterized membrane protein YozB (DUF420 family)